MCWPFEVTPWVRCSTCGAPVTFAPERIADCFKSLPLTCPSCNASLDWWSISCREIEDNFMHNQAFVFVGARTGIFKFTLQSGKRFTYRFSNFGIPIDAKILYVNYTPNGGGLFPTEIHGNVPTRKFISDEVTIFPVPFGAEAPTDTEVNAMVSWVPTSQNDESLRSLVDAFEAYANGSYPLMIVPANVAVESALSRLLSEFLNRFVAKKRAEDFLENAATYGHQLNVLLPIITSLLKLAPLPDYVRGSLNKLRSCRNQLAHSGVLKQQIDKHAAAQLLCGSLFGLHYVRYLESQLPRT